MKLLSSSSFAVLSLLQYCIDPCLAGIAARDIPATVELDYATLNGYVNGDNNVTTFLGVPYAEPPVGHYRFRAPAPVNTSRGEIDASHYAESCIPTTQSTAGEASEDCLYGNIWVPPGTKTYDRLPVLMFFHGGGYQGGSTREFSGDDLLKSSSKPLIFATFSYRLGQFGFLGGSKVAEDGDGNVGLIDQREAMRWVQKYIHNFGGDKSRVTIWGQSAGAGSMMFQLTAKDGDSEGLFHRVIGDSPASSSMAYYNSTDVESVFHQIALLSGCLPDSEEVMDCLRKVDVNRLAKAGQELLDSRPASLYPFSPILDGSFLTKRPVDAFTNGKVAKVPVIFGSNSEDGASWSSGLRQPEGNTSMPGSTEDNVYFFLRGQYPYFTKASFDSILEHYVLSDYENSVVRQVQQMYGEVRYACAATLIAQGITGTGTSAWHYRYDNTATGATHGAELRGMFRVPQFDDSEVTTLFSQMREYWTSFATSGTPSASGGPTWESTSSDNKWSRLLLHQGEVGMEELATQLSDRCDAWHSFSKELLT